jgi:hypothetical protein
MGKIHSEVTQASLKLKVGDIIISFSWPIDRSVELKLYFFSKK